MDVGAEYWGTGGTCSLQECQNRGQRGVLAPPALFEGGKWGKEWVFCQIVFSDKSFLPPEYHKTFEFGESYVFDFKSFEIQHCAHEFRPVLLNYFLQGPPMERENIARPHSL